MNAIFSLSHFCETHGPTVLLSTQAFHFAGEDHSGTIEPLGVQFFGCVQKLKAYNGNSVFENLKNTKCEVGIMFQFF